MTQKSDPLLEKFQGQPQVLRINLLLASHLVYPALAKDRYFSMVNTHLLLRVNEISGTIEKNKVEFTSLFIRKKYLSANGYYQAIFWKVKTTK